MGMIEFAPEVYLANTLQYLVKCCALYIYYYSNLTWNFIILFAELTNF